MNIAARIGKGFGIVALLFVGGAFGAIYLFEWLTRE